MGRLFGTDGARRRKRGLTCELAMQIGRAAAAVCRTTAGEGRFCDRHGHAHIVGYVRGADRRAVLGGRRRHTAGRGAHAGVAYLVVMQGRRRHYDSASHNSSEFNGIKIFSGDGYKLPDLLEEQIEAIVLDHIKEPR